MRAVVYSRYGSPAELRQDEVPDPTPQKGEVLVRVRAVGLNSYDWRQLRGEPFLVRLLQGLFRPRNRILGSDVAGVVEAVGSDVARLAVGDQVFGCLESCGKGGLAVGGLAELVAAKANVLATMPPGVGFEQAAALPMAGGTALQAVRAGKVAHGTAVAVNGAAGGVGTFTVQIAKALGAEVTGVCSTGHTETTAQIGADHVVDYTAQDFTQQGRTFDVIVDNVANRTPRDLQRALRPGGICVVVGFSTTRHHLAMLLAGLRKNGTTTVPLVADNRDPSFLRALGDMMQAGQLTPVVDRVYPVDQAQDAFAYLGEGHAGGKVVVSLDPWAT